MSLVKLRHIDTSDHDVASRIYLEFSTYSHIRALEGFNELQSQNILHYETGRHVASNVRFADSRMYVPELMKLQTR